MGIVNFNFWVFVLIVVLILIILFWLFKSGLLELLGLIVVFVWRKWICLFGIFIWELVWLIVLIIFIVIVLFKFKGLLIAIVYCLGINCFDLLIDIFGKFVVLILIIVILVSEFIFLIILLNIWLFFNVILIVFVLWIIWVFVIKRLLELIIIFDLVLCLVCFFGIGKFFLKKCFNRGFFKVFGVLVVNFLVVLIWIIDGLIFLIVLVIKLWWEKEIRLFLEFGVDGCVCFLIIEDIILELFDYLLVLR